MKRYRIKIKIKESGNIHIPQIYQGLFLGWCGFMENLSIYCNREKCFNTIKEAESLIEEVKKNTTTEVIYKEL